MPEAERPHGNPPYEGKGGPGSDQDALPSTYEEAIEQLVYYKTKYEDAMLRNEVLLEEVKEYSGRVVESQEKVEELEKLVARLQEELAQEKKKVAEVSASAKEINKDSALTEERPRAPSANAAGARSRSASRSVSTRTGAETIKALRTKVRELEDNVKTLTESNAKLQGNMHRSKSQPKGTVNPESVMKKDLGEARKALFDIQNAVYESCMKNAIRIGIPTGDKNSSMFFATSRRYILDGLHTMSKRFGRTKGGLDRTPTQITSEGKTIIKDLIKGHLRVSCLLRTCCTNRTLSVTHPDKISISGMIDDFNNSTKNSFVSVSDVSTIIEFIQSIIDKYDNRDEAFGSIFLNNSQSIERRDSKKSLPSPTNSESNYLFNDSFFVEHPLIREIMFNTNNKDITDIMDLPGSPQQDTSSQQNSSSNKNLISPTLASANPQFGSSGVPPIMSSTNVDQKKDNQSALSDLFELCPVEYHVIDDEQLRQNKKSASKPLLPRGKNSQQGHKQSETISNSKDFSSQEINTQGSQKVQNTSTSSTNSITNNREIIMSINPDDKNRIHSHSPSLDSSGLTNSSDKKSPEIYVNDNENIVELDQNELPAILDRPAGRRGERVSDFVSSLISSGIINIEEKTIMGMSLERLDTVLAENEAYSVINNDIINGLFAFVESLMNEVAGMDAAKVQEICDVARFEIVNMMNQHTNNPADPAAQQIQYEPSAVLDSLQFCKDSIISKGVNDETINDLFNIVNSAVSVAIVRVAGLSISNVLTSNEEQQQQQQQQQGQQIDTVATDTNNKINDQNNILYNKSPEMGGILTRAHNDDKEEEKHNRENSSGNTESIQDSQSDNESNSLPTEMKLEDSDSSTESEVNNNANNNNNNNNNNDMYNQLFNSIETALKEFVDSLNKEDIGNPETTKINVVNAFKKKLELLISLLTNIVDNINTYKNVSSDEFTEIVEKLKQEFESNLTDFDKNSKLYKELIVSFTELTEKSKKLEEELNSSIQINKENESKYAELESSLKLTENTISEWKAGFDNIESEIFSILTITSNESSAEEKRAYIDEANEDKQNALGMTSRVLRLLSYIRTYIHVKEAQYKILEDKLDKKQAKLMDLKKTQQNKAPVSTMELNIPTLQKPEMQTHPEPNVAQDKTGLSPITPETEPTKEIQSEPIVEPIHRSPIQRIEESVPVPDAEIQQIEENENNKEKQRQAQSFGSLTAAFISDLSNDMDEIKKTVQNEHKQAQDAIVNNEVANDGTEEENNKDYINSLMEKYKLDEDEVKSIANSFVGTSASQIQSNTDAQLSSTNEPQLRQQPILNVQSQPRQHTTSQNISNELPKLRSELPAPPAPPSIPTMNAQRERDMKIDNPIQPQQPQIDALKTVPQKREFKPDFVADSSFVPSFQRATYERLPYYTSRIGAEVAGARIIVPEEQQSLPQMQTYPRTSIPMPSASVPKTSTTTPYSSISSSYTTRSNIGLSQPQSETERMMSFKSDIDAVQNKILGIFKNDIGNFSGWP